MLPVVPIKIIWANLCFRNFYHGAQPIDQSGLQRCGWNPLFLLRAAGGHCNLGKLNADFTGFEPWEDGELFHEITPEGYVEGPFMFLRKWHLLPDVV